MIKTEFSRPTFAVIFCPNKGIIAHTYILKIGQQLSPIFTICFVRLFNYYCNFLCYIRVNVNHKQLTHHTHIIMYLTHSKSAFKFTFSKFILSLNDRSQI